MLLQQVDNFYRFLLEGRLYVLNIYSLVGQKKLHRESHASREPSQDSKVFIYTKLYHFNSNMLYENMYLILLHSVNLMIGVT